MIQICRYSFSRKSRINTNICTHIIKHRGIIYQSNWQLNYQQNIGINICIYLLIYDIYMYVSSYIHKILMASLQPIQYNVYYPDFFLIFLVDFFLIVILLLRSISHNSTCNFCCLHALQVF